MLRINYMNKRVKDLKQKHFSTNDEVMTLKEQNALLRNTLDSRINEFEFKDLLMKIASV